jgi:hypothetical protein
MVPVITEERCFGGFLIAKEKNQENRFLGLFSIE